MGHGGDGRGGRRTPLPPLTTEADRVVRAHLYDADGKDRKVALTDRLVARLDDRQLLWIDLDDRDPDRLAKALAPLHQPMPVRAMASEVGRARLIRHDQFVHLTIQSVESDDGRLARREVDLLAGPNVLVTVHDGPVAALDDFSDLIRGDTLLGELDSGSFVAALVDSVLSTYFARVEEIEREIDRLDELALGGRDSERFLVEVLRLRRRIALLRRTLAPHREAFAPLGRSDFELDERLSRPWPRLLDRLERAIDAVENARELLVGTFDIYLGGAAQRTNDVMKALTILSAVLLPAGVLAGVMGMNFQVGFFDDQRNFWLIIAVMAMFAASLLAFARLRRWI